MTPITSAVPLPRVSRTKLALVLAWTVVAMVLTLRAGFYPAVMTGDEVWFAESAFQFLHHGQPLRAIHADAVGSATADFLPPVTMLVQAAAFAVFGVSPLAVAAQSVIAPLAVSVLIYLAARRAGVGTLWAGLAALALMGSPIFLRAGLYIRYESLVTACFLAYLAATLHARRADNPYAWRGLAGFWLALAGLSYYPLAPFVGLAAAVVEGMALQRPLRPTREDGRAIISLVAGFAVPAILFAWYVGENWAVFAIQVLQNGSNNYLVFELPRRMFEVEFWLASRDVLPELVIIIGALVVIGRRLGRLAPLDRSLFLAAAVLMVPAVIYPFQPRLLAPSIAVLLVLGAIWAERAEAHRLWARAALFIGAGAASAVGLLLVWTSATQFDGRDYAAVASRLERLTVGEGPVAIDQRAWLALRAHNPNRELHHVMPGWAPAQVRVFESSILRDPTLGTHFEYVVLNAADAVETVRETPALARAFQDGQFMAIGRVQPLFRPLPWAKDPPYDLIVFARRDADTMRMAARAAPLPEPYWFGP
ncbi:MAG: hypothetical protein EAZ99_04680 [Alphaproteobacteria bacterium]|nr:glycosyltransferase family 39 protein [Alphaproteobacteria bacterium]TAD90836.1 MAG: hypothetical protein EAZ99_04680 [Alphaproteobacteria bacterium]